MPQQSERLAATLAGRRAGGVHLDLEGPTHDGVFVEGPEMGGQETAHQLVQRQRRVQGVQDALEQAEMKRS